MSKWADHALPRIIPVCGWDLPLPCQDLPQSNIGLKNTHRIRSYHAIRDAVEALRHVMEADDGGVIQGTKLREDKVLVAESRELARQDTGRLGVQAFLRRTYAVNLTQFQVGLERPVFRVHPRQAE